MMICPKCYTDYEGDHCPNCKNTDKSGQQDLSDAPVKDSNAYLFIILGMFGMMLVLMTLAALVGGTLLFKGGSGKASVQENVPFRADEQSFPVQEEVTQAPADPEADKAALNAWQRKSGKYQSGDYEVGTDVPAGTYFILSDGAGYGDFYAGVYAAESMSSESEIYGGFYKNICYIVLEEGQYLHFSHSTMYALDSIENPYDPFKGGGMFLVGTDVEPGTYCITCDNDQYSGTYEIYSTITSSGPVVKDSGYIESNDSTVEITLNDGEYLKMDFCQLCAE